MPQLRKYEQGQTLPPSVGAFDRVMDYLHTVNMTSDLKRTVANRLLEEVLREEAGIKMEEQFRLKKELEHFSTFGNDWDGEGGIPLREASLRNFELLLPLLSVQALRSIEISPENNGTLLVTSKVKEAGVNIGDNTFTYYSIENGKVEGESQLTFDTDRVLEQIERLTE